MFIKVSQKKNTTNNEIRMSSLWVNINEQQNTTKFNN